MICINLLVFCNIDLSQKWGDYARIFSLMNAFSKLGNKIFIVIIRPESKSPQISNFKENGLDVIEIHPPGIMKFKGKRGIGKYLNYLSSLPTTSKIASKIIKDHGIDYVYAYMPGIGSSLPAMRVQSKHKIKFVLDFADLHVFVRPKKVTDASFQKADEIIAITSYLKDDLLKRGISEKKIHIIPNGVDLKLFDPAKYSMNDISNLRESFGTKHLLVFAGSLQDLNLIIDSAKDVIEKVPDVKYLIIGDHRDPNRTRDVWEAKVKEKGLTKNFVFLGRKPRDEIPKYVICADVCLDSFPDEPYYAAAHPVKLLEYGACGKPVVATRVTETAKLVQHGVYGFLATPGNGAEYANYIVTLLADKEKREKMGKEFSSYVRSTFDWNKIAIDLENVLKN
ncbi:Putative glycosyltransferase [Nitrosotalea devaniterrae]|uniref:Glycosyltransferase n=1 Tax=Nitrosotalea devaniterrae TaxID=1078905 RepID=A0A128A0X2_9ARCH|nr:Putative glycosyltransferase [Candidatus Nitrosotalea devanaterra]